MQLALTILIVALAAVYSGRRWLPAAMTSRLAAALDAALCATGLGFLAEKLHLKAANSASGCSSCGGCGSGGCAKEEVPEQGRSQKISGWEPITMDAKRHRFSQQGR